MVFEDFACSTRTPSIIHSCWCLFASFKKCLWICQLKMHVHQTLHKFFWLLHTCFLIGSFINDGRNRPSVHNMNGSAHQQTSAAMSPNPVTFTSYKNRWSVAGNDALNDLTNGTKTSTSCFRAKMISFQYHHKNPPSKIVSNERYDEGTCILTTKCHCH